MPEKPDRRTLAAFITIVLFLGVNFIAVRFSNQELPPFWGAALRFMIASAILFAIVGVRKIPLPRGRALTGAVVFGLLAFTIGFALMYWALTVVGANMASVTLATIPLITLMIAGLAGQEKITRRGVLGGLIVIAGFGVVFFEQLQFDVPAIYLAAVFLAAICFAGSAVAVKYFPRSNPFAANAVGMSVSVAALLVLSLLAGEAWALPTLPATWLALAWVVLSSIVGFVLLVWLLAHWSASAASYQAVCSPLVTVAAVLLLTGERPTVTFLVGSVIVLLGVYAGALSGQRLPRQVPADIQVSETRADM